MQIWWLTNQSFCLLSFSSRQAIGYDFDYGDFHR